MRAARNNNGFGSRGGELALDRGDLFADAAYYRLTRDEAATRYATMKSTVQAHSS